MIRHRLLGRLVALAFAACACTRTTRPTLAGQWVPLSAELGGQAFECIERIASLPRRSSA
jgi:hypothetical protein